MLVTKPNRIIKINNSPNTNCTEAKSHESVIRYSHNTMVTKSSDNTDRPHHILTWSSYNIDDTRREARFNSKLAKLERREWCDLSGLENDSVTGSEAGSHLPGKHHQWIIPWRYDTTHAAM